MKYASAIVIPYSPERSQGRGVLQSISETENLARQGALLGMIDKFSVERIRDSLHDQDGQGDDCLGIK